MNLRIKLLEWNVLLPPLYSLDLALTIFIYFDQEGNFKHFDLKSSNFSKHGIENLVVVNEGGFNKSHFNDFNLSAISILKKNVTRFQTLK